MTLSLMSFNIRYGDAQDGDHVWPNRRDLAVQVIRDHDPAFVGLQEALRYQIDELRTQLPAYEEIGVGRDDGVAAGEHAAILYHRDRLNCLGNGTFWFSDTPDVPGSMTWGNTLPRICTWGRFNDRRSDRNFYVYNLHWDHASQPSRERSAVLLLERIQQRAHTHELVIVTGDFNVEPDNPAFRNLTEPGTGLVDVLSSVDLKERQDGTFHNFHGNTDGGRIDAILVSEEWNIVSAEIDRTNQDGRYPSDHFPVTAALGFESFTADP